MMKGPLLTKNYVGTDAEVAGWGIYDIGMFEILVKEIQFGIFSKENNIPKI